MLRQQTLNDSFCLAGIGMHTGEDSRVIVGPAHEDEGIVFVTGAGLIPARAEFVTGTRRCTTLHNGSAAVSTMEHLLAALAGMGVDNARIQVDGPEVPILDGSALPWVEGIRSAGLKLLDAPVRAARVSARLEFASEASTYIAEPAEQPSFTCTTEFDHPLLGRQTTRFDGDRDVFVREIAPARTFGFEHEVAGLLQSGLAKGGHLGNALVIYADRFSSPERVPQECARHKLLDLIGDLSLTGFRINAHIIATRPSHRGNVAFARMLQKHVRAG